MYGPKDNLFLPNLLEAAGTGKLRVVSPLHARAAACARARAVWRSAWAAARGQRCGGGRVDVWGTGPGLRVRACVCARTRARESRAPRAAAQFGDGSARVCWSHVDNYAHALVIAERVLRPGSPAIGRFYIVTDGDTHPHPEGYLVFWRTIDEAVTSMGFTSIWTKMRLPVALLWVVAYVCELIGWLFGMRMKLNRFAVRLLTMHRWFRIDAATRDLGYAPIVRFEDGWADTIAWFRAHWLPVFRATRSSGVVGLSAGTQFKIDVQASGTGAGAGVGAPAAGGDGDGGAGGGGESPASASTRARVARRTHAAE